MTVITVILKKGNEQMNEITKSNIVKGSVAVSIISLAGAVAYFIIKKCNKVELKFLGLDVKTSSN